MRLTKHHKIFLKVRKKIDTILLQIIGEGRAKWKRWTKRKVTGASVT
jgi:hypothetical protein